MKKTICVSMLAVLLLAFSALANNTGVSDNYPVGPIANTSGSKYSPPQLDWVYWTTGTNMPTARAGAVTGFYSDTLFVAHGQASAMLPGHTNVCEAYDINADVWYTMTPAPTSRSSVGGGQVQTGDTLYSIGGLAGPMVPAAVGTNEAYNMCTDTWWTCAPCTARYNHGAAVASDNWHEGDTTVCVFVFGGHGIGTSYMTSAEGYNPGLNMWYSIGPLPVGHAGNAGASVGNKIYSIGGFTVGGFPSALCYEYDPLLSPPFTPGAWTAIAPLPNPRGYATAVGNPLDGKIYVFGGDIGGAATDSVLSYDPVTNTWTDEGVMPAARYNPAAATNNGQKLFIIGGSSGSFPQIPAFHSNTWIDTPTPLWITMTPCSTTTFDSTGGTLYYNIAGGNSGSTTQIVDIWADITKPNGQLYGPILGPVLNFSMTPGFSTNRNRELTIPGNAPVGTYSMNGYLGSYSPVNPVIYNSHNFNFYKTSHDGGEAVSAWFVDTGEPFEEIVETACPVKFNLVGNYPNPFNPTTTISFELPTVDFVHLAIYDVSGRLITELVNGWRDAGQHVVTFDASGLASGVYVYRLKAGDFTASCKMVLMK